MTTISNFLILEMAPHLKSLLKSATTPNAGLDHDHALLAQLTRVVIRYAEMHQLVHDLRECGMCQLICLGDSARLDHLYWFHARHRLSIHNKDLFPQHLQGSVQLLLQHQVSLHKAEAGQDALVGDVLLRLQLPVEEETAQKTVLRRLADLEGQMAQIRNTDPVSTKLRSQRRLATIHRQSKTLRIKDQALKAAHAEIKQRDEEIASLRAQLAAKKTRENSHQSSDSLTRQIKDRLHSINQLLQDEMEVVPSNSHKQDAVDALLLLAESGDDPVTE